MAGIENLGAYGELTTAAKAAGGVEQLIANLEAAAVSRAATRLRVQGVALGVGGVLSVLSLGGVAYYAYRQRTQERAAAHEVARAELREAIGAEQQAPGEDIEA
ncbi:hypothetical protein [Actinomyces glycerinitolerans]|uniref:Uncharacterized protein n=1 Tax=Actinomyces glycerinitolerans TaxID=1892869 RepID=A0A1M4S074_9ACTO|nr:hypothetical protein [Actinomyces glycerinitolerans]SHE25569.1 Hypothetical protein ACGLYG10_1790 [Actinomyces glycerinitolerans]